MWRRYRVSWQGFVIAALLLGAATSIARERADPPGMVKVPAGRFVMGDDTGLPEEKPRRDVQTAAFLIDRTEVSNARYGRFLDAVAKEGDSRWAHPAQPRGQDHTPRYWKPFVQPLIARSGVGPLLRFDAKTFIHPDHPVVGVDWFDAQAFCAWDGKRLPTEAEWEKAARGVDGRVWPWGDRWEFKRANSGGYERHGELDVFVYTAPVDSFKNGASPFGALNMAGNVWEWTQDPWTAPAGSGTPLSSRGGPADSPLQIIKGGAFNSYPSSLRPARRDRYEPGYRAFNVGFRCAANADR